MGCAVADRCGSISQTFGNRSRIAAIATTRLKPRQADAGRNGSA
jgi:hypothetical protein